MVGRTILNLSLFVLATCVVVLAFVVTGEVVVHWLRPSPTMARLKLEMLAANPPDIYPSINPQPVSAPSIPAPVEQAQTAPPATNPFEGVAKDPSPKPTPLNEPLGYAESGDPAKLTDRPSDPVPPTEARQPVPEKQSVASAEPPPPAPVLSPPPGVNASPSAPAAQNPVAPQDSLLPQPAGDPQAKPGPTPAADAQPEVELARRSTFKSFLDEIVNAHTPGQSLRIVQIGDSHTAADMFTGEVRQKLQAAFGDGGAGYLDVGKPHPGVRSEIMKMTTSPGWTYTAIQRTEDASQFRLSGFNAIATKGGETLTLSSGTPIDFDSIDIAVKHGPDSGAIELRFDNDQAVRFDLKGDKPEWWFLRATSQRNRVEQLKQLTITTLDARPVDISSVAIFNETYGVSYSAIGFPGATVDIVNKFPSAFFTSDLQRINPQIVVLAFGTNEGFDDALDIPRYGERYQKAIDRIRTAVPHAEIVLVGPANSNRLPRACRGEAAGSLTCRPPQPVGSTSAQGCFWQTPPKLDRVREMQKLIADHTHLHFWNWSEIQAPDCGAHQWATASPRLMQPDHVHFTAEGYRIGADKFAEFLMPIIDKLRRTNRVVPTIDFAIFFAIVFPVTWLLNPFNSVKKVWLVAASYLFYSFWNPAFLFLLLFSSVGNFAFGLMIGIIQKPVMRRLVLGVAVAANLCLLGYFKYYNFLSASLSNLFAHVGLHIDFGSTEIALPIAISFLTFHGLSYVIDVFRNRLRPSRNIVDLLLYISFFPHLVAGPIVRAHDFLPQLARRSDPSEIKIGPSVFLILGGLFKKVIIASHISTLFVDPIFVEPTNFGTIDLLIGMYAYAIVIYCDFSAYTDIAIGIANLLGYQFPQNFNQPYRALSLQDFWRRWHITLSTWLRDYLYISLGGNRHGTFNTYRNLIVTMVLGGLWHGAGLQFIVWGLMHGLGLAGERALGLDRPHVKFAVAMNVLTWFVTFHFVCIAWVFFRSTSLDAALDYFRTMVSNPSVTPTITLFVGFWIVVGFLTQWVDPAFMRDTSIRFRARAGRGESRGLLRRHLSDRGDGAGRRAAVHLFPVLAAKEEPMSSSTTPPKLRQVAILTYATLGLLALAMPEEIQSRLDDLPSSPAVHGAQAVVGVLVDVSNRIGIAPLYRNVRARFFDFTGLTQT